MKVLVLCGDLWHSPQTARDGLEPLKAIGYAFDFVEDAAQWSYKQMKDYPLTILTKANHVSPTESKPWMTPTIAEDFRRYVTSGGGLLVIHSGSALYDECEVFRQLLGGLFVNHPDQCSVLMQPVSKHALATGEVAFAQIDEHYMMNMHDPTVDIFLTTQSRHGSQPGGWTRSEGSGRVCVVTPGHNLAVWVDARFQSILHAAISWCSKSR